MRDDYIATLEVGKTVAHLLLKSMEDKQCRDVANLIFQILFSSKNSSLIEMLDNSVAEIGQIRECEDGEVLIYNYRFCKAPKLAKRLDFDKKTPEYPHRQKKHHPQAQ